jgi:hypothetical protein
LEAVLAEEESVAEDPGQEEPVNHNPGNGEIVFEAQLIDNKFLLVGFFQSRAGRLILVLLTLLLAGFIAFIVGLPRKQSKDDGTAAFTSATPSSSRPTSQPKTLQPTQSPTMTIPVEFTLSMLPNHTQQAILLDPTSPQGQAWHWLQEDSLIITNDIARTLQRYALATLYFASNGPSWIADNFWMDHNMHECDWTAPAALGLSGTRMTVASACNERQEVTDLTFASAGMSGTLPEEISLLSRSLEKFKVYEMGNALTGTIPTVSLNLV